MKRKGACSVSVIGGADGPTSFFIAGKSGKRPLKERIQRFFYRKKRRRIEKTIAATSHTLEEVIQYLQDTYGAVEESKESHAYVEEYQCLKTSLIIQHKPELLGDMAQLEHPKETEFPTETEFPLDYDEESLKEFWKQIELRNNKAQRIPEQLFPMDFHIYRIKVPDAGEMHFSVETVWEIFGGSYSGSKKGMKELHRIARDIYLYYGVTEEDIRDKSDRYSMLVTELCT